MREKSEQIERELKFVATRDEDSLLGMIRELLDPSWTLVKSLPTVLFDVYLDTPDLFLYRNEQQFRLRKRKGGKGWNASFKTRSGSESRFSNRHKVQTRLSHCEVMLHQTGEIPGSAAANAYAAIRQANPDAPLRMVPVVHLVSHRTAYKVLAPDFVWGDDSAGQQLLFLAFEEITALDVRSVVTDTFLRCGWLDYSEKLNSVRLSNTEFEARGEAIGMEEAAEAFLIAVGDKLRSNGITSSLQGKYFRCVNLLKIAEAYACIGS